MKNSLFLKLTTGLLVLLLIMGAVFSYVSYNTAENYNEEANQRLHKSLAQYTVDHVETFDENGVVDTNAIVKVMNAMMIINPDVEVYLVDRDGALITYAAPYKKIVREKVSLAPLKKFIEAEGEISIKGDDPRSLTGQKVFSAAPILQNDEVLAYYYIILASQERAGIFESYSRTLALGIGVQLLLISLALAFLFGLLFIWYNTRNLNPILSAMDDFSNGDYTARIPKTNGQFQKLGETYNAMASQIGQNIEKIKSIDGFRKELIANISHDIRTPLTVVTGYAEMLSIKKDKLSKEEQEKYLLHIQESSKRASGLLNQLIELSKLENDQMSVTKEPFSLNELVSDLVDRYEIIKKEKNINIKLEKETSLPLAFGDISLMERVIQNLLDNAIKYSPDNSEIIINLAQKEDGLLFSISDQGMGMNEKEITKIFDRYKRLNPDDNDNKSMGLGLAIAKKVLELHESSLKVKSKLNEGTTFWFDLSVS